jgi:[amino group carrier protein]-lysine/ornithine hydrolase
VSVELTNTAAIETATRVLFDLVATPSVSGSERAAVEVFVRHGAALGFQTEIDAAGNGLAHRGASAGEASMHIVLLGHIDTVPGHIPVRIENGVLHGRGSVDAKGPLAAMLVGAANAELPAGVRVTVAGAVGEETPDSPGARFLAGQLRPHACIIGEPSGWDGVTLGYKGRLLGRFVCERSCAHTAGRGLSAADEVLVWWTRVLADVTAFNTDRTKAFDQIQATVRGLGTSSDGLTDVATLDGGFRLPPAVDPRDLAARLAVLGGQDCSVAWRGHEVAHATDRNDPVVRALTASIRERGGVPRPKLKTGTSDLNVVAPIWNCPIAAYGPGDSSLDHTPDERLGISEYLRSVEVIQAALVTLARQFS